MSNWATLHTQPSQLPQLPAGTDPRTDWFTCKAFACKLPKQGCANRYRLAQGRTSDGLSYEAVTYGACRNCPIGAAHAAGLPTPTEQGTSMEESITTTNGNGTNGHAAKHYKDRICGKCKRAFSPTTATERRCRACTAEAKPLPARRAARNGVKGRRPAAGIRLGSLDPSGIPPARAEPRVLHERQIATATELLEIAGFTVRAIRTPAGEFLQVT
ncbi:MAG TPA: hypothetical protein VGO53_16200 [Steroidobacteraceae bacterium]|jgi:hypothetical protein|nr:hypothetical protein [Steroidobacteraceae bacterium]